MILKFELFIIFLGQKSKRRPRKNNGKRKKKQGTRLSWKGLVKRDLLILRKVMWDVFKMSTFFSGSKQKRRRKNNRKMTKNFKNEVLKN